MKITQRYGKENTVAHLFSVYKKYGLIGHNGVDIVFKDKLIYSPIDGEVVYLAHDYSDGYGAYVKVLDTDGNWHYFCHLREWDDKLKSGFVKKGQLIGIMGGSSLGKRDYFGAHLHYGIKPVQCDRSNGYRGYIDPETVIDLSLLAGEQI